MVSPRISFVLFLFVFIIFHSTAQEKERILVLTDIEADPDDAQSLVRFLTYSNKWDVEGLIATTSIHQKDTVAPQSIVEILEKYEEVLPNLLKHEKGFPSADSLMSKVKKGLPIYGMAGVGEGKDSEGSEWIIKVLEEEDDRPLWVTVWGGPNTLAQALWKIKETKSKSEAKRLIEKLRVYTISDQDDSGPWMRKTFPELFFIVTPGYLYGDATWIGIAGPFPGSNTEVISDSWLANNIQQDHSSLGAAYPDVAYIMEGDSPSFLYLIPNGLNEPEHPNYGGWGGRYEHYTPELKQEETARPNWPKNEQETRPIWTNAEDSVYIASEEKGYKSNQATIWRWRKDFQNDFAARMDWTHKSYEDANHPPVPRLNHPEEFTVKSGEKFYLDAKGTTDPDGDSLSYLWFQYPEAGTYEGLVSFSPYANNIYRLPVIAMEVDEPKTVHFILKVTDKGEPSLSRYRRVIVKVIPN